MCRVFSQHPGDEDSSGTCAALADGAAMLFRFRERFQGNSWSQSRNFTCVFLGSFRAWSAAELWFRFEDTLVCSRLCEGTSALPIKADGCSRCKIGALAEIRTCGCLGCNSQSDPALVHSLKASL